MCIRDRPCPAPWRLAPRCRRRPGRTGARDFAEAIGGALDAEDTPWRPDLGARCMDGTAAVSTAAGPVDDGRTEGLGFERHAETSIVIAAAGVPRAANPPPGGSQAGVGQSSAPRRRASSAARGKAVRPPGEPLTVTTARAVEGCIGLGRTSRCAGNSSVACLPADVPPESVQHVRTPSPATCTTTYSATSPSGRLLPVPPPWNGPQAPYAHLRQAPLNPHRRHDLKPGFRRTRSCRRT